MPDLPFSSTQLLAGLASFLLLFVSAGVVYLSAVEWRDRRRRRAAETAAPRSGKSGRSKAPGLSAGSASPGRRSSRP